MQAQPVPTLEGFQLHASVFIFTGFQIKVSLPLWAGYFVPRSALSPSTQVRHRLRRAASESAMLSPRVSCSPAQLGTLTGRAICAQDLAGTLQCSPRLHSDISALSWRTAAGDKAVHDALTRKMSRLAAKRCGARASGTEFVAFVTSQYLPEASGAALGVCGPFVCSLVQWARQVHRLASGVQALAGEPASVHLFTPCLPPSMADTLSDGGRGARVVVHRQHAPRMHAVALQRVDSLPWPRSQAKALRGRRSSCAIQSCGSSLLTGRCRRCTTTRSAQAAARTGPGLASSCCAAGR